MMPEPRRDPDHAPEEPIRIDAADARGADIVLRNRRQRWIFLGGLVAAVVLVIVLQLFA